MKNRKMLLVAAIMLVSVSMVSSLVFRSSVSSEAQTTSNPDMRIFLNIQDILGESQDTNHTDWIEIEAFNWSEAAASVIAGRGAGVVSMKDFIFVTATSRASPRLFLAVATGQVFPQAELQCWTRSGETTWTEFLRFQFESVVITSYNVAGSAPDYRPVDQFSITFRKITMTYWMINANGSQGTAVSAWYDLTTRRGG
jgi:type VI secretion system secreted protein Hcp